VTGYLATVGRGFGSLALERDMRQRSYDYEQLAEDAKRDGGSVSYTDAFKYDPLREQTRAAVGTALYAFGLRDSAPAVRRATASWLLGEGVRDWAVAVEPINRDRLREVQRNGISRSRMAIHFLPDNSFPRAESMQYVEGTDGSRQIADPKFYHFAEPNTARPEEDELYVAMPEWIVQRIRAAPGPAGDQMRKREMDFYTGYGRAPETLAARMEWRSEVLEARNAIIRDVLTADELAQIPTTQEVAVGALGTRILSWMMGE
jgi:hypothetical protein